MPDYASGPDTLAIGDAIVSYLSALTFPDATLVYTLAQLEAIPDILDLIAGGGVCCEVYGAPDTSEQRGYGGRMWDTQQWIILSLCSRDNPTYSRQIYKVRDALVYPFQQHAQLGGQVSNLFQSRLEQRMEFGRVLKDRTWVRSHMAILTTKAEWAIQGGVIS